MAYNIYIESNQAIPSVIVQDSLTSAPTGFSISANQIIDWDKYASNLISNGSITTTNLRKELILLYQSASFSTFTTQQKIVFSKWYIAKKTERDSVRTVSEQFDDALILSEYLNAGLINKKAEFITGVKDNNLFSLSNINEITNNKIVGTIIFSGTKTVVIEYNVPFDNEPKVLLQLEDVSTNPPYIQNSNNEGFEIKINNNWSGSVGFIAFEKDDE